MRESAKTEREHTIANVGMYHRADYEKHCVFLSDRPMETTDKYYTHFIDGTPVEKALFGFEWETQDWGIKSQKIYANVLRDIVFQPFHKDLWKIEDDCSLNQHGAESWAENITQPMTKAYIRNHYRDFKYMWEKAEAFGIDCEKTGDCGMHIHISNTAFGRMKKTQDEAIKKLLYIVNKHYGLMLHLFHRNPRVRHYCDSMEDMGDMLYVQNMNLSEFYNDHYVCINMGHYNEGNIELRIVGGQKNYPCFRNTFEAVFHIVETVKSISWNDCDDITRIFKGCNQYVYNRLSTYCHDNVEISSAQLEKIYPTVKTENLL